MEGNAMAQVEGLLQYFDRGAEERHEKCVISGLKFDPAPPT
jgi:hypothetical protein